ncbi:MAG: DUF1947 domain-containing protein [Asgard group archaeon]|nr:DUF1947 domain-containing protein [Asgard group archaeon]
MKISKRHPLRKSKIENLKSKLREQIGDEVEEFIKDRVEKVETDEGILYAQEQEIIAFRLKDKIYPSLQALNKDIVHLPTVTVDMGAVPYVTNGADIMAPGITNIEEGIKKGDIIAVIDENYGKSLAVGKMLYDREQVLQMKKGKVITSIHYVNDEIWSIEL